MLDDFEFTAEAAPLPVILLIDDERFIHDLVVEALKDTCEVMSASDGADAVMAIESQPPALIILDVEMPGISGLDLCRAFREFPATADIPVIFLSGHDEIEDRVAGYQAGGDDYVVKPFSMRELRAKVQHLLTTSSQYIETKNTANFATSTAMTVMSSMGEMGVLLEALKKINVSLDFSGISEAAIAAMTDYGLRGAVQIRTAEFKLALNSEGEASDTEIAVIERMIGIDRIFQFGRRMLITYDHFSLLVSNLPLDDPDRIGRLRDHLAMLAEGADMRVQSIVSARESQSRGETIGQTLLKITDTLKEIDIEQRNGRLATSIAVSEMSENIGHALLSAALSESQEDYLTSVIRTGVDKILDTHSGEFDLQEKLSEIIRELKAACGDIVDSVQIPHIAWSELFSVGHAIIDEDHKTLLMRINQLYDALATANPEQIERAVSRLTDHTRDHFAREEDMMKKTAYSGLDEHCQEHEKLARELQTEVGLILQQSPKNPDAKLDRLKSWLVKHIVTDDRALAEHLAHRQVH